MAAERFVNVCLGTTVPAGGQFDRTLISHWGILFPLFTQPAEDYARHGHRRQQLIQGLILYVDLSQHLTKS